MDAHEAEHDQRYAKTSTVYVVMQWDKYDRPEVICGSEEVAQRYIDGQWSKEGYSTQPMTFVESLPAQRPLWTLSGRLPYPSGAPSRERDEFAAKGEFPGLGNGDGIPLGDIASKLTRHRGGWQVNVTGWGRKQVEAQFETLIQQAEETRAALVRDFSRYTPDTIVACGNGDALTRTKDQFGTPCWVPTRRSHNVYVYDYDVDAHDLQVLHEGQEAQ